jgi:hypothetical protein
MGEEMAERERIVKSRNGNPDVEMERDAKTWELGDLKGRHYMFRKERDDMRYRLAKMQESLMVRGERKRKEIRRWRSCFYSF